MGPFGKLADLYTELEDITSHKKIVELLAFFFQKLDPDEVKITAYLALGTIGPKFEDTELGIGEKLCVKSIASAYEIPKRDVERKFSELGDLGDVAFEFNKRKKSSITVEDVFNQLVEIKETSGEGSQAEKISLLSEILSKSTPKEAKYIIRIALGRLRLGFGEQFLIEALAVAFTGNKENAKKIEDAYNICTDIGQLAESLSKYGISSLRKFSIKLGRPVQMMLAKRISTIKELNEKFPDEMAAEEKYDGERIQIHVNGSKVRAFSRRLEDISKQFPDLIKAIRKSLKSREAVLDGEIVAYKNGKIDSFQALMQRRRKYDVDEYIEKVPVAVFLFDILYLDGKSLLKIPYPERRNALEKNLEESDKVKLARRIVSADFSKIQDFFDSCINKGLEGIIVKSIEKDSIYQPGKRGWLWVKWKKEYSEGMRETFDLVIVGSYYGKGKRKGTFGSLLCAVLNKDKNRYETFTKVGTGFTDEDFDEIGDLLEAHAMDKIPVNVFIEKDMRPDRYIEPSIVIEVLGSEITTSPIHTAGKDDSDKGFALRFPRFLRMRYDKSPTESTTVQEIKDLK